MKLTNVILAAVIFLVGLAALNACQTVKSPIEDYTWVLTTRTDSGNVIAPLPDTEITILFKSEDKTFSGNAGCNYYSGTYSLAGTNLGINENIAVTEMWCGEEKGRQETEYLAALADAVKFEMDHGNLIMFCGQQTLYFSRE